MIRRRFALHASLMFLAMFVGYHFQADAQQAKKDDPAKKEAKKDDTKKKDEPKKDEPKKEEAKKEEKKDEKKDKPKKEPFAPGVPVKELKGHADWIKAVVFRSDGKKFATASRDRTVKVWEVDTGKDLATFKV